MPVTDLTDDTPSQEQLNKAKGSILKLPPEIVRMIFEHLGDVRCRAWLASIATLCKVLVPEVEAALYRTVVVTSCKNVLLLYRSLNKRPYRALTVRTFEVSTRGGASIKKPLNSVFQMLTSLERLELAVDEPSIFSLLLVAPFRLRVLVAGGSHYPTCFEDILASQPSLWRLSLTFTPKEDMESIRTISRPDILPNLRSITGFMTRRNPRFPFVLITHPYPLVHLALVGATPGVITHAISLFGNTLIRLTFARVVDAQSLPVCYFPTYMFRNAHLPKLERFMVIDQYNLGARVCHSTSPTLYHPSHPFLSSSLLSRLGWISSVQAYEKHVPC